VDRLDLIGDVQSTLVIAQHTMAWYQQQGQNFGHVNRDILTMLDASINFALYDNWTSDNNGTQTNAPDGKVEMIFMVYRYLPTTLKAGYGNWTGIAGLGVGGVSTIYTNDYKNGQQVYIEMGTTYQGGSGVTIAEGGRDWWDESTNNANLMASVAHEFGHYVVGNVHYLETRGGPGLMGNGSGPAMNPFERERLGYMS